MATSPQAFFRFLAEHTALVIAIYDRGEVDEAELLAMIGRFRTESQPESEYIRHQIQELGVVEQSAQADASFELSQAVVELLLWLTRRQRLSSATVLRAFLSDMDTAGKETADAVRIGDANAAVLALRDLDGLIERIRQLSGGNRDSVVSEALQLRAATSDVSAVDRFSVVRRIWERYLVPLRDIVSVQGEMEQLLDRMKSTLDDGEHRFLAHAALQQGFTRAVARLARMRRSAADDHRAAVLEIAPLYERFRRDSRWVVGASRALARIPAEGTGPLRIDQKMRLTGWRTRYLISDDQVRARFAALAHYEPQKPPPIADAPPPPEVPLITRESLREAITSSVPIDDVLAFVLARWPDHPLASQLRAFGQIVEGAFGPLRIEADTGFRTYQVDTGLVEAWPIALLEVAA